MKSMALDKQMELFDEGGLMQEGGSIDEESGNDVPVGSLKEEVRDDIPAQLSEGEFVMPADVVRFHGLDKMMALRDEAKTGLQRMDDMGQMGNSEEAVIPDGIPFGMDDLELEDEPVEMQVGGFVQPQTGMQYTAPSTFQNYAQTPVQPFQPQQPVYGQGVQGGYQPQFSGTQQQQQAFKAPTFDTLMPTYITYVNSETKAEIQVPVDASGNPLIPIPAGFVTKYSLPTEEEKKPETPAVTKPDFTEQDTSDPSVDSSSRPRLDQFGREKDPRISQVTSTKEFSDLSKKVDPRGLLSKIIDGFTGAIGVSTTSQEYQNALDELSVGVANYTSNPEEQKTLLADITGKIGTISRTAAGEPLASVISGDVYDAQQKTKERILTDQDRMQQGQTSVETTQVTGDTSGKTIRETGQEFDERVIQSANALMARDKTLKPNDAMMAAFLGERDGIDKAREFLASNNRSEIVPAGFTVVTTPTGTKTTSTVGDQTGMEDLAKEMRSKFGSSAMADDPAGIADSGSIVTRRDRMADDPAGIADSGSVINTARNEEIAVNVNRYRAAGYSPSKAATAARNKTIADEAARKQTGNPNASAVTGSTGKAVTSINAKGDTVVVTTIGPKSSAKGLAIAAARQERNEENATDSRVICTELHSQGKLSEELYKMDMYYTKRNLSETTVRGYHYWAIPMVPLIRKNNLVCSISKYLAVKRAEEIAHIIDPVVYPKSTITGKLIKTVGEAICYGIGKFVKQKDYSVLYNGKSV